MATLLYVSGPNGPQPQVIPHDRDGVPFIDAAIRGRVLEGSRHLLTIAEAADLASGSTTLTVLSGRYPPLGGRAVARQGRTP